MYELITGKLPFSGESAVSIALKHLQTETPSLRDTVPDLPQSLENVVLKATAKNIQHRYQSADEMEEDLATVLLPERLNEPKFTVPVDQDETRAMPAIKDPAAYTSVADTKTMPLPLNEVKKEQTAPVKKKKKKWPWIVGILAFLLIGGLVLALAFPGLFEPRQVAVPDVSEMEQNEAVEELQAAGFVAGEETEEYSEEIEANHIIRTIPEAGKMRDRETEVQLFVSMGKERAEMADFVGDTLEEATEALKDENFASVEPVEEFSDEPVGTILNQEPAAGEEVIVSETDVEFIVSKGKDMRNVEDLAGFTEENLNEYARSSGFNIRIVSQQASDEVEAGRVMSQTPAAGEQLEARSTIEVVLSAGEAEQPMKTYIHTVEIPYEPAEPAAEGEEPVEQTVQIYIQDNSQTMVEPFEEFTITEDQSHRIELQIAEGESASYRIVRDSTVILEETFAYSNVE